MRILMTLTLGRLGLGSAGRGSIAHDIGSGLLLGLLGLGLPRRRIAGNGSSGNDRWLGCLRRLLPRQIGEQRSKAFAKT